MITKAIQALIINHFRTLFAMKQLEMTNSLAAWKTRAQLTKPRSS